MMIDNIAKWTVFCFGLFFVMVGLVMLLKPKTARAVLRKAGSTNFINYAEITLRMVPAAGLILYADLSKYPVIFHYSGWFMLGTSLVLYFVPRQVHHAFSTKAADFLKPVYFQLIAPFAILMGFLIMDSLT